MRVLLCVHVCVHVQVHMQLCVHVRACVQLLCRHWSVCVLRLDLLSQTRVRVVCRDTCMRARSILSWREAHHITHSRGCTPHTQAHYPRTLLPSIHSRCLTRCFSLTTASRPKPCLLHPHTRQCVSASAPRACEQHFSRPGLRHRAVCDAAMICSFITLVPATSCSTRRPQPKVSRVGLTALH